MILSINDDLLKIFIEKCKIITLKVEEGNLHFNENAIIYFIQNALKTIKTDVKRLKSSQKLKFYSILYLF